MPNHSVQRIRDSGFGDDSGILGALIADLWR